MTLSIKHALAIAVTASIIACAGPEPLGGPDTAPIKPVSLETASNYPARPFWGDTHVHTNLSVDAHGLGNENLGPDAAYQFARGEPVVLPNGQTAILRRPLDFLVVADHAEFLGVREALARHDEHLLENETARHWHYHMTHPDGDRQLPMTEFAQALGTGEQLIDEPEFYQSVWKKMLDLAEEANEPGVFTALAGYEWSSAPEDNNLHRVVVFRDGIDKLSQHMPFSALDGADPEQLWDALSEYEAKTGGQVLTIPHNSNISGGKMFEEAMSNGAPIDKDYAETRARFEKIIEVTQMKGDSETHPFLSPDDEFADFERWDRSNIGMRDPHEDHWFKGEYARSALKMGLQIEGRIGVNPYQFGMIGSTDSHTSMADASEDDFPGKFLDPGPGKDRWNYSIVPETVLPQVYYEWELAAAGYAAVWALENTRESIFDALERRETYATTGPRMDVRFFAGWEYEDEMLARDTWISDAYAAGETMGGVLDASSEAGASPTFIIHARRDEDGANLDRVQVVKGWTDATGEAFETVYDVATADAPETGAEAFHTLWRDPDFNPEDRAFYYLRVMEIPTPRWTTYDMQKYGAEVTEAAPRMIQERAYTSPIWYAPG